MHPSAHTCHYLLCLCVWLSLFSLLHFGPPLWLVPFIKMPEANGVLPLVLRCIFVSSVRSKLSLVLVQKMILIIYSSLCNQSILIYFMKDCHFWRIATFEGFSFWDCRFWRIVTFAGLGLLKDCLKGLSLLNGGNFWRITTFEGLSFLRDCHFWRIITFEGW